VAQGNLERAGLEGSENFKGGSLVIGARAAVANSSMTAGGKEERRIQAVFHDR